MSVASKSVEDCMRLAQEWLNADHAIACVDIMDAGNQADRAEDAHVALQAAIVAYGDAQWNAAIEAAANKAEAHYIPGHSVAGPGFAQAGATDIRGLKR